MAAACHVASGMLVARRIPYRVGGHALPTGHACHAVHGGCTAAAAPGRERSDEACKTTKGGSAAVDLGRWRTGGGHGGRWSGVEETKRQTPSHPDSADMSKLLDAVEKKEWEKMMVRRLLEVVWYLQRI